MDIYLLTGNRFCTPAIVIITGRAHCAGDPTEKMLRTFPTTPAPLPLPTRMATAPGGYAVSVRLHRPAETSVPPPTPPSKHSRYTRTILRMRMYRLRPPDAWKLPRTASGRFFQLVPHPEPDDCALWEPSGSRGAFRVQQVLRGNPQRNT